MRIGGGCVGAANDDRNAKTAGYITGGGQPVGPVRKRDINKSQIWMMPLGQGYSFHSGSGDAGHLVAELLNDKSEPQNDKLIIFSNEKPYFTFHSSSPHPDSMVPHLPIDPD